MAAKVSNNAYGLLSAGINTSVTALSVGAGEGARFPALGAGDYFYATLMDTSNNLEIIKVTARSVDSFTIVRAQDGTTAKVYALSDRVELRPVAALFNEKVDLETVTSVARGGTGVATLSANAVVLGNGTSAVNLVAPSTSGNILTSNGTVWVSSAPAVATPTIQVFTASGTYTKPAGLVSAKVTVVGGGGAGGANGSTGGVVPETIYGAGGGGGGTAIRLLAAASIGATVTVTVGGSGATSSFGSLASATAGAAGTTATAGGAGGLGASGNINIGGSAGVGYGGSAANPGGSSTLGGGSKGTAGRAFGGGGGSGSLAGGAGIVIVEEYY